MLSCLRKKTERGNYMIFSGSQENFIRNGAFVLEESISTFHGRINPIRYFSVDELNNMNMERHSIFNDGFCCWYPGSWDEKLVLLKLTRELKPSEFTRLGLLREIVVATQMATHYNVHKLLGCCVETESPVLVYEWVEPKTLQDHTLDKDTVLEWKDRLRIAWEISHAVSYLHTAFPRPIIHRDLKPSNVFLNHEKTAYLFSFYLSVSIPEGEESVEPKEVAGTFGYMAPEYAFSFKVAESTDVYSFGVLLLALVTLKNPAFEIIQRELLLDSWVQNAVKDNRISKIVDPAITRNGVTATMALQLSAYLQLALLCTTKEADSRPTMVEVATKLKNIITSPESIPNTTIFQVNAANERMLGGGGVDGAIHRAAGPELKEACYKVPEVRPGVRCPTGEARITPGFRLPASHVIHTVGPIYDVDKNPEALLKNAYRNSLLVAKENNIQYIAFPAISCGVYGYPYDEAASIAISTVKDCANDLKEVCFVLFADDIYNVWLEKTKELTGK